jgi:uncharacterized RDD family membrane protein YckC
MQSSTTRTRRSGLRTSFSSSPAPFYETIFHGSDSGQTPGKRLLGIRIRGEDGGRLSYGRAFGRWVVAVLLGIFTIPLLISYLRPLWNEKNRRGRTAP